MRIPKLVISFLVCFCLGIGLQDSLFANSSVDDAVNWANGELNTTSWTNLCFVFVRTAYEEGSVSGIDQAMDGWGQAGDSVFGTKHTSTDYAAIPKGALVFFNTGPDGHIGLSIGNGQMIHAWIDKVREEDINAIDHYLGWRWPTAWTDDNAPQLVTYTYFRAGNLAWFPPDVSCINADEWIYYNLGYPDGGMSVANSGICYSKESELILPLGGLGSDWWQILYGSQNIDQYKVCQ